MFGARRANSGALRVPNETVSGFRAIRRGLRDSAGMATANDPDNRGLWSLWTLLQRLLGMLERGESLSEPAQFEDTVPVARPAGDE